MLLMEIFEKRKKKNFFKMNIYYYRDKYFLYRYIKINFY